jgi:hypothetical protein
MKNQCLQGDGTNINVGELMENPCQQDDFADNVKP